MFLFGISGKLLFHSIFNHRLSNDIISFPPRISSKKNFPQSYEIYCVFLPTLKVKEEIKQKKKIFSLDLKRKLINLAISFDKRYVGEEEIRHITINIDFYICSVDNFHEYSLRDRDSFFFSFFFYVTHLSPVSSNYITLKTYIYTRCKIEMNTN